MESIFVNPYRKEIANKFYDIFLQRLRDEGKISERIFQQISIVAVEEPVVNTLQDQISNEIWKMRVKLEHSIATSYTPESTRWYRNYTDRADWYYLCRLEGWF